MGVHVVKRHAIVDVLCHPVVNVVIGVHIVVLFVPLVVVHCRPDSPCCDTVSVNPTLSRSHFLHVFTVFSRHFRCGIYTSPSVTVDRRQL